MADFVAHFAVDFLADFLAHFATDFSVDFLADFLRIFWWICWRTDIFFGFSRVFCFETPADFLENFSTPCKMKDA